MLYSVMCTICGWRVNAMPVQRSTDCLAMIVNVIISESTSSDHCARYLHSLPTQRGGVDHQPRLGDESMSAISHSNYSQLTQQRTVVSIHCTLWQTV